MKFLPAILLAVLALLGSPYLSAQLSQPKPVVLNGIEGKEAPLLDVDTWIQLPADKDKVEITDYPDKVVVMLFFQHLCPASQERELPVLKRLVDHYRGTEGIVFLAIQTTFENYLENTSDKLEATARKFDLPIPFGHSPKLRGLPSVSSKYLPAGTPWWVIIDRAGKVEYNGHILNEEEAVKGFDRMLAGLSPD